MKSSIEKVEKVSVPYIGAEESSSSSSAAVESSENAISNGSRSVSSLPSSSALISSAASSEVPSLPPSYVVVSGGISRNGAQYLAAKPPPHGPRAPVDIVFVLDTSGSMDCAVAMESQNQFSDAPPTHELSMWNLVSHASQTILECLTESDRAAIVLFSTVAECEMGLTRLTPAGKAKARWVLNICCKLFFLSFC